MRKISFFKLGLTVLLLYFMFNTFCYLLITPVNSQMVNKIEFKEDFFWKEKLKNYEEIKYLSYLNSPEICFFYGLLPKENNEQKVLSTNSSCSFLSEVFKKDPEFFQKKIKKIEDFSSPYYEQATFPFLRNHPASIFLTIIFFFVLMLKPNFLNIISVEDKSQNPKAEKKKFFFSTLGYDKYEVKNFKDTNVKLKLDQLIGIDKIKEECSFIIDMMKNSKVLTDNNLSLPSGIILHGPPGCGKTLLAKAIASESGFNFFSGGAELTSSPLKGVEQDNLLKLFAKAKDNAPSVIFLDEIDSIAPNRINLTRSGLGTEETKTVNTLLELLNDVNQPDKPVLVIAATNRLESLDPAVIRSGRFDKKIYIGLPGKEDRLKLFQFYYQKIVKKVLSFDISLLVNLTTGMSPADIETIVKESYNNSLKNWLKDNKKTIEDFNQKENEINKDDKIEKLNIDLEVSFEQLRQSIDVILRGDASKRVLSHEDKKTVAYHELGHAVVGALKLPNFDIQNISIISKGPALGVTILTPKEDKTLWKKEELKNYLSMILGGRAAEAVFLNDITTGASDDINRAKELAKKYIQEYNMNDDFEGIFSGENDQIQNKKIESFLKDCYEEAKKVLKENQDKVNLIALILIEKEEIYQKEFMDLLKNKEN